MFEDIFEKFYEKNREIKVIGVWGKDGLELEKKFYSSIEGVDLDLTGAELADVISKVEGIKLSPTKYIFHLDLDKYWLVIYSLTPEFFLVVVSGKTIIKGKLNFYLEFYKNKLISRL